MKKYNFDIPILFIVFNRPGVTKRVFNQIQKLKPSTLYIAADGPRKGRANEYELCRLTRKVTENINWKCKVKRLYRDTNLGCGKAVSSAIGWFFDEVEMGIILEDDCVPNNSFFVFCRDMLNNYKNDNRVMHITGDNFLSKKVQKANAYYLSKYVHVWGWATWKRSWKKYDYDMKQWKVLPIKNKLSKISGNIWDKMFWTSAFDSVAYKLVDTWDYQWVYTIFNNGGLSIVPGVNTVSNIGFGNQSTHTKTTDVVYSNLKTDILDNNLSVISRNVNIYDKYESNKIFKTVSLKTLVSFIYFSFVIRLLRKLFNNKS